MTVPLMKSLQATICSRHINSTTAKMPISDEYNYRPLLNLRGRNPVVTSGPHYGLTDISRDDFRNTEGIENEDAK